MREIYLDNSATTEPLPEVRAAMARALKTAWGNPSSAHSGGAPARQLIGEARDSVAALVGADPSQVCFVSGGTEANVVAIRSCVAASPRRKLITAVTEHSSVVKTAEQLEREGVEVVWLKPTPDGPISPEEIRRHLATGGAAAVSIQWVNNETGVINDVVTIQAMAREYGALFHCDAAQAVGKLHVSFQDSSIDILTFTGHKFHGPAGTGAVVVRDRRIMKPILFGGDQEASLRPGTENIAGIVGFGTAAEARRKRWEVVIPHIGSLRDRFESELISGLMEVRVNGGRAPRVCSTTNLLFPAVDGQALIAHLDAAGVRCSQSSACTNSRPEPSYVLRAMGLSEEEAYRSVRFSFSESNTPEEVDRAVALISRMHARLTSSPQSRIPSLAAEVGT